jgi:hypothetical protein
MDKEEKKKYRKMLVEIVTIYYIEHIIQYDKKNKTRTGKTLC